MASDRTTERIASWIQRKVATMLVRDLKDPRAGFLLTVTRVKVSKDLETCTVYFSVLGDDKQKRRAIGMLDHATSWIQREVAKGLAIRTAPRLHFEFDESIEGTARMTELLEQLAKNRQARQDSDSPPPDPTDEPSDTKGNE